MYDIYACTNEISSLIEKKREKKINSNFRSLRFFDYSSITVFRKKLIKIFTIPITRDPSRYI